MKIAIIVRRCSGSSSIQGVCARLVLDDPAYNLATLESELTRSEDGSRIERIIDLPDEGISDLNGIVRYYHSPGALVANLNTVLASAVEVAFVHGMAENITEPALVVAAGTGK